MGKKNFVSEIIGANRKKRPLGKWKDWVKEHIRENGITRGGELEQAKKECLDMNRGRFFCCGHPLG